MRGQKDKSFQGIYLVLIMPLKAKTMAEEILFSKLLWVSSLTLECPDVFQCPLPSPWRSVWIQDSIGTQMLWLLKRPREGVLPWYENPRKGIHDIARGRALWGEAWLSPWGCVVTLSCCKEKIDRKNRWAAIFSSFSPGPLKSLLYLPDGHI